MTTQAITINELTFTEAVASGSNDFLLQNITGTNIDVVVRVEGATGLVDPAVAKAAIQLYPGYALNRSTVGTGSVWVRGTTVEDVVSVTGG